MNQINPEIIEICVRMKITDYLSSKGIPYKRSGSKWKCCCPLHQENTPSMWISTMPDGAEVYKCFGCGKSGNIITLISEMEHVEKGAVVSSLAKKFKLKLGKFDKSDRVEPLKDEILEFFCQEDEIILDLADYMVHFLKRHQSLDTVNKISRVYEKIDKMSEIGDTDGMLELIKSVLGITVNYSGD